MFYPPHILGVTSFNLGQALSYLVKDEAADAVTVENLQRGGEAQNVHSA